MNLYTLHTYSALCFAAITIQTLAESNGNRELKFKIYETGRIVNGVFAVTNTGSDVLCYGLCLNEITCISINFNENGTCELSSIFPTDANITSESGWTMAVKYTSLSTTCWMTESSAVPIYTGSSCADLYRQHGIDKDGVYDLQISVSPAKFIQVYCDMTHNGGGWTVIQRRQDGSVDFYRDWANYTYGFGDLNTEFWLGNELIHDLVSGIQSWKLRIDLQDADNNWRYAEYDAFHIASDSEKYKLTTGSYSGNAGDGLSQHSNKMFTTKDSDNDSYGSSCATLYKGAWWYTACHSSNLNGLYTTPGPVATFADNMVWQPWRGHNYCLKTSIMKFRPNDFT